MKTIKEEVKELIDNLPENCTIEDIQYHLYVLTKVKKGIERAEKEGNIPHQDVKKKING